MGSSVSEGMLHGEVPFLRWGSGPPLVMLQGLSLEHRFDGMDRWLAHQLAAPFADHFTVTFVTRKRGLTPGQSMSEIAGHIADAVEHDIGEPVMMHGTSTGGSVALQLTIERPDLVRRLVVLASACRLGPRGRRLQADLARRARTGDPTEAMAHLAADTSPRFLRAPVRFLMAPPWARRDVDPTDMLVTIDAEDAYDVTADLHRIAAPTLVIGGARDEFYPAELFRETASGVQDGRAVIYPKRGHVATISGLRNTSGFIALGFLLAGDAERGT